MLEKMPRRLEGGDERGQRGLARGGIREWVELKSPRASRNCSGLCETVKG